MAGGGGALLITVLACAAMGSTGGSAAKPPDGSILLDQQFSEACAPVAVYAALRYKGIDLSLAEVAEGMEWDPEQGTRVSRMVESIKRKGLSVVGVSTTFEELSHHVERGRIAILLTSGGDAEETPGHAIAMVARNGSHLVSVEYPHMSRQWDKANLEEIWDGAALLIYSQEEFSEIGSWWSRVVLASIGGIALGAAVPIRRL